MKLLRWCVVVAIGVLCTACSSVQTIRGRLHYGMDDAPEGRSLLWPAAPEVPRFLYSGTLTGEANFRRDEEQRDTLARWARAIVGLDEARAMPVVLQRPSGVIGDDNGRLYVSDTSRQAVFVFDEKAGELLVWDRASPQLGFVAPAGLALAPQGGLYVADADLAAVVRLDAQGQPQQEIGRGQLRRPTGLARDARRGVLFVADTYAHDIKVFSDAGELLHVIGARGSGSGEFNYPTHLAFVNDELYVTDTMNNRVQVLDADGHVVQRQFGERGLQLGNLVRPKGVSVDSEGNVYVIESYYDSLLVFSPRGEFLLPIGGTGTATGRFYLPAGVWVDARNRVHVADMFNGRVVLFQFLGGQLMGLRRFTAVLPLLAVLCGWLPAPLADAQRISDVRNTAHNLSTSGPGSTHATGSGGTTEICVFCHTPHGATTQDQGGQPLRAPLWNRRVPAGSTYTPYTSSTLDAQSITDGLNAQPGGSSKLCLSCHDGTLAIGNVNVLGGSTNVTIEMTGVGAGGVMPAGEGTASGFTRNLGTDLRNDHPISVTYNAALAARDGELRPVDSAQRWPPGTGTAVGVRAPGYKPMLPLEPTGNGGLGQVQCASCHDPHLRELDASKGNQKFLRAQRFQEATPSAAYNQASDIICLSCHDKNLSQGMWANSAHANPLVADETYNPAAAALRQFPSGLPVWKAACLNCHDTHTVQGARRLTREGTDAVVPAGTPLAARQGGNPALEKTCYQCHTTSAKAVLNNVSAVPNVESEFDLAVRMPITTAEQGGVTEEVHDISSNFSDPEVNCSTATNRCGADLMEPKARLGQRHVECTDCHNPHRVIRNRQFNADPSTPDAKGTHRIDAVPGYTPSNLASGVLRGSWGVEPGYGSPSFQVDPSSFTVKRGDPAGSAATDLSQPYVTREYQVCLKCHSNYAFGSTPPSLGRLGGTPAGTNNLTSYTNQAREFQAPAAHVGGGIGDAKNLGSNGGAGTLYNAGNHRSWHPVMNATGRDIARRGISAAKMPWLSPFGNAGAPGLQTMYCTDCHGSSASTTGSLAPDSGVMGPHGSQNSFLLKAPFTAGDPSLCFKCHDRNVYSPVNDDKKSGFYTGFCCRGGRDDGNDQLHWYHWNKILSHDPGRTLKCNWCHAAVPHGWKNKALLVNLNDVGEEAGFPSGNREFRSSASGHAYNQQPYYLNAKVKIRTFATSGNWSDSNCGSNGSALTFGSNSNSTLSGKDWMKDTCSSPP